MRLPTYQQFVLAAMLAVVALAVLPGCVPTGVLTSHVDKVCRAGDLERERIRANVDTATYPHKVRVECN